MSWSGYCPSRINGSKYWVYSDTKSFLYYLCPIHISNVGFLSQHKGYWNINTTKFKRNVIRFYLSEMWLGRKDNWPLFFHLSRFNMYLENFKSTFNSSIINKWFYGQKSRVSFATSRHTISFSLLTVVTFLVAMAYMKNRDFLLVRKQIMCVQKKKETNNVSKCHSGQCLRWRHSKHDKYNFFFPRFIIMETSPFFLFRSSKIWLQYINNTIKIWS